MPYVLSDDGNGVLAHLTFGAACPDATLHAGLQPLGDAVFREVWRSAAPVDAGRYGSIAGRANAPGLILARVEKRRVFGCCVAGLLTARLADDVATVYLHAGICRVELLVEIEGVYAMPGSAA